MAIEPSENGIPADKVELTPLTWWDLTKQILFILGASVGLSTSCHQALASTTTDPTTLAAARGANAVAWIALTIALIWWQCLRHKQRKETLARAQEHVARIAKEADSLRARFVAMSKELKDEFPAEATEALASFYEDYIVHLTDEHGTFIPRAAYMSLLMNSAARSCSFFGVSRVSAKRLLQGKLPGASPEDSHIYDRFDAYNDLLESRTSMGYPTTRIFVLEKEVYDEDDDPYPGQESLDEEDRASWWDLMVKEHTERGFYVSRVVLTDYLRHRFEGNIDYQISVFTIAGSAGWLVVDMDRRLSEVVRICCRGRRGFHRYGYLCQGIREHARVYVPTKKVAKDKVGHYEPGTTKVPDIMACLECPENGTESCGASECSRRTKNERHGDAVSSQDEGDEVATGK